METTWDRVATDPLEPVIAPRWSSLLFRGIASAVFGVVALAWPGITLVALTFLFGAFAFVDGLIMLAVGVQSGKRPHRWLLLVEGLLGIVIGVLTVLWPGPTLLALVFFIGLRFVLSGVLQIAAAIQMRHEMRHPLLFGLAGASGVIFGMLTFAWPGMSALVLVTFLGVYALLFGALMLLIAIRLRLWRTRGPEPVAA